VASSKLLAARVAGGQAPGAISGSAAPVVGMSSSLFDLGQGADYPFIDAKFVRKDRPEPLKVPAMPGTAFVQRSLEIPREVVGLIIGQSGKKIKELCTESNAKIQFKVNKTAEREGRPGLLEVQGSAENVDKGLHLVWGLLQLLGKEYNELPSHGHSSH
jgi:hypothetical protein